MRRLILLCLLLLSSAALTAQVDYLEYKKRYSLLCGLPDSTEVARNRQLVDSLSGMEISIGKKEYFYDLGWVYYMRYLLYKEREDIQKAHTAFLEGWEEHQDLTALWNLGTTFKELGQCAESLNYTELYLQELPEDKKPDYQQIYYRYKNCSCAD